MRARALLATFGVQTESGVAMMRQAEQQQRSMSETQPFPSCNQSMRLVGRESASTGTAELLTFQCSCGQIIAANGTAILTWL
jgi:hypothetical protein